MAMGGDNYRQRITLNLNTPATVHTSDAQTKHTDGSGSVKFDFNKELTLIGFHAIPDDSENYQELHFEYNFQPTIDIVLPPVDHPDPPDPPFSDWGTSTPEAEGVDGNILNGMNPGWFEDVVIIRNDKIIWQRGNVDGQQTNLASVCRFWLNFLWGTYLRDVGFDRLNENVSSLSSPHAAGHDFPLKYLLSYTAPDGNHWQYSDGPYWELQHRILEDLYNQEVQVSMMEQVMQHLGGTTFDNHKTSDDGTNRIYGSIKDIARGARLLFKAGEWNDLTIFEADYAARSVGGGPNGNGSPYDLEGYQTHLIRHGSAWEMENNLPGVPDGFMARSSKSYIIGIPSLNMIMAGKGPEQFQDVFLPTVVSAFH